MLTGLYVFKNLMAGNSPGYTCYRQYENWKNTSAGLFLVVIKNIYLYGLKIPNFHKISIICQ